jgi:hypothetical protein
VLDPVYCPVDLGAGLLARSKLFPSYRCVQFLKVQLSRLSDELATLIQWAPGADMGCVCAQLGLAVFYLMISTGVAVGASEATVQPSTPAAL